MKITTIKVFLLEKPLDSTMRISRGGFTQRQHLLVQVWTDEGLSGLGEAVGNPQASWGILQHDLIPRSIGKTASPQLLREELLNGSVYYERKGSAFSAFSAIEMALWDIQGKALNVPCYELFGGLVHSQLETYVSSLYWDESLAALSSEADRILSQGFQHLKVHLGVESPEKEADRIRLLREKIPDGHLMVDLNAGYDYLTALRAIRLWERFGLYWIEEPLHPDFSTRIRELRSHTTTGIALGENEFGLAGFQELLAHDSLDIAMPDVGRVGGIWESKKIAHICEARGILFSPHNFSSGVLWAATAHLMASTPNARLLEWDASQNGILFELLDCPIAVKGGIAQVPTLPGLGVRLSETTLKRYCTQC